MPKDERQLENDASNSSAFHRRRKDVSEGTVLKEDDSKFQACAAATGNARSPSVERRVDGTASVDVVADRR